MYVRVERRTKRPHNLVGSNGSRQNVYSTWLSALGGPAVVVAGAEEGGVAAKSEVRL